MTDIVKPALTVVRDSATQNGHSRDIPTSLDEPLYPLTDLGNAERLVHRHGDDLRFVAPADKWRYWDGTRWHLDVTGEFERRAKETIRSIYKEAEAIADPDRRKKAWKHAESSEGGSRLGHLRTWATREASVAVEPDLFDRDPWLLNCPNGTLDLRTLTLREHQRQDYLTRVAGVSYQSDMAAPLFGAFLDRVFAGNDRLIEFLQRAIGYSLTGLTAERALFFLYGLGANGKSLLMKIVRHVLGDYAKTARPEAFMVKPSGEIPNELASLAGARLVSTTEVEEGTRLAESLVKQITGGDQVSARFLRAEFFDFEPTMKIWMMGNHKPGVRGADLAMWERILTVPFDVTIPKDERDPFLFDKLKREAAQILAWAVEGCRLWQIHGLDPPPEVLAATEEYRAEVDVLSQFLEEYCELVHSAVTPAAMLYAAYAEWCKEAGERQWTQQLFGRKLHERGLESDRHNKLRVWLGVGLKAGRS